jgi:hypothetical protein
VCLGKTNHPLEEIVENLTGDLFWSCNLAIRRDIFERLGGLTKTFSKREEKTLSLRGGSGR